MKAIRFVALLTVAWCVMTFSHEIGHILGGTCCGATLRDYELRPWKMPYSLFEPDPKPLVTLWSGPLFGVIAPFCLALLTRKTRFKLWGWFLAYFCLIANGTYLATAWVTGDQFLDTTKLLKHGAHPVTIAVYCMFTIGLGYWGFRAACIQLLSDNAN